MTNVFFKLWKIGSLVFLSITLLYCYTSLPESIAVGFAKNAEPIKFITKQEFFYWTTGVILGINLLMNGLKGTLAKLNFKKLFGNTPWLENPESLTNLFKGWFDALLAFINTYLVFVLVGLYEINSDVEQKLDFNYNYILWIGILILLIIILFLPYKLLATQPVDED